MEQMSAAKSSANEYEELHIRRSEQANAAQVLIADLSSATLAALTVSPVMTIIDRAVVEAAVGQNGLRDSVKSSLATMFRNPGAFFLTRPFGIMFLLYSGTYTTANCTDTFSSARSDHATQDPIAADTLKFATVTTVNVGLSLCKDSYFARYFGGVATRSLPFRSYAPFLVRDAITLYASFNLPAQLAPKLSDEIENYASRLSIAQLVIPASSQLFATPLHLLGLDLYYWNGKETVRSRLTRIAKAWPSTSFARDCRVLPAYGLGGVVNHETRSYMIGGVSCK